MTLNLTHPEATETKSLSPSLSSMITSSSDLSFDQVDAGQTRLEGNSEVGQRGEALSALIPLTHGTSLLHDGPHQVDCLSVTPKDTHMDPVSKMLCLVNILQTVGNFQHNIQNE